ncbi:hypothetical protein [Rathayibacter rathayi]|uniref:hypothetical protein n=1 Tax=Rathayibacter rathayi TaxID=33887 RepID=UPI0011B03005|nr:hypothetical protein [Rathayibacter rathayi]
MSGIDGESLDEGHLSRVRQTIEVPAERRSASGARDDHRPVETVRGLDAEGIGMPPEPAAAAA